MRARRIVVAAAMGLVALVGVTGCGAAGSGGSSSDSARPQSAPSKQTGGGAGANAEQGSDQGARQQAPASAEQRMVVRSAQLSLRVEDVPAATREVTAMGPRFGGYVADEQADNSRATVQLKVESDKLDQALEALAGLGEVSSRSQQATDVTEQAVDLQARVAAQRASVERVRTLLANATTVGEIVQIEAELTTRQAELDSLEQRLAALQGKAALSDITVSVYKSSTPVATEDKDDTGFLAGLAAGWGLFLGATEVGLTVIGALLPFLVVLAIPVTIAVVLLKRRRKPATPAAATATPAPPAG